MSTRVEARKWAGVPPCAPTTPHRRGACLASSQVRTGRILIMKCSIVIVSWNTRDLLAACLESVYAAPPSEPYEVWVVDNASTDGSADMVRRRFPGVRLVAHEANLGFAGANNLALRRCRGDYVLLLNPDTIVQPEALNRLIHFLDDTPRAGGAGALLLNPDHTLQASCHPRPTLGRELWRLLHLDRLLPLGDYEMARWDRSRPRQADVIKGAALMLRRQVLDQIGLLDETYFMYSEEVDLCYRLQQAGWQLFWVPAATVIHYGGQSTQQVAGDMFLRLYQGKILYFRKHHGFVAVQVYRLILLFSAAIRIGMSPVAALLRPSRRPDYRQMAGLYWRLVLALPRF